MKLNITLSAIVGFTLANFITQNTTVAITQSFLQAWALGWVYLMHKFID